jgi:hypothetical protein
MTEDEMRAGAAALLADAAAQGVRLYCAGRST